jgi:hypothetical protein
MAHITVPEYALPFATKSASQYRLLAHTTENDEILIKVLAHARIPQAL